MKNIILFIITAIARAIASLLGLRSWAKAKKADVNLYLTEEDYSSMRMFPDYVGSWSDPFGWAEAEFWSPSGSETTRTESDWHPPVGHYSKVHVPQPAGSGVMTSANVSVYPHKGGSDPELRPSRRRSRFYMAREARQHIAEEVDMWNRGMNIPELIHHLKAGHMEYAAPGFIDGGGLDVGQEEYVDGGMLFYVHSADKGHFSCEMVFRKRPDFDVDTDKILPVQQHPGRIPTPDFGVREEIGLRDAQWHCPSVSTVRYEYAEHGLEDTKNPETGAPWNDLN